MQLAASSHQSAHRRHLLTKGPHTTLLRLLRAHRASACIRARMTRVSSAQWLVSGRREAPWWQMSYVSTGFTGRSFAETMADAPVALGQAAAGDPQNPAFGELDRLGAAFAEDLVTVRS